MSFYQVAFTHRFQRRNHYRKPTHSSRIIASESQKFEVMFVMQNRLINICLFRRCSSVYCKKRDRYEARLITVLKSLIIISTSSQRTSCFSVFNRGVIYLDGRDDGSDQWDQFKGNLYQPIFAVNRPKKRR